MPSKALLSLYLLLKALICILVLLWLAQMTGMHSPKIASSSSIIHEVSSYPTHNFSFFLYHISALL